MTLELEGDENEARFAELATEANAHHAALAEAGVTEAVLAEYLDVMLLGAASALVVERYSPRDEAEMRADPEYEGLGDLGLFGPFPKDTAEVHAFIEQRQTQDASEGHGGFVDYRIRLLFEP
jgi:hypothetical protein